MRRLLLAGILIATSVSVFAQDGDTVLRIDMLINDGLYSNYDEITAESLGLTPEQRYQVFLNNEADAILPFVLNLLVGLGVGSFVQGDIGGGLLGVGLDVGGIAAFTFGYLAFANAAIGAYADPFNVPTEGLGVMLAGGAIISFSRIYQLIRPFTRAQRYNDDLRHALGM